MKFKSVAKKTFITLIIAAMVCPSWVMAEMTEAFAIEDITHGVVDEDSSSKDELEEPDEVMDFTEYETTKENDPEETEEPPVYVGDGEEKIYADGVSNKTYQLEYESIDANSVRITGYTGTASGDLVIPSTIDGKTVTNIGRSAFYNCKGFTGRLMLPNSVITIEVAAFQGCSGFTGELIIPNSVTDIGNLAFYRCSGFEGSLIIPESVTGIADGAFAYCSNITSITIPDSVTYMGLYALLESDYGCCIIEGCSGLNKVTNNSDFYVDLPEDSGGVWKNIVDGKIIQGIYKGTAIRKRTEIILHSDNSKDRTFVFNKYENIEDILSEQSSDSYNPRLAYLLSVIARGAYTSKINLKNYEDMGFSMKYMYIGDSSSMLPSYFIGEKENEDGSHIVLISIKGTTLDDMTSFTDMSIGQDPNGLHVGFNTCANTVYQKIENLYRKSFSSEKVTFVVTGHSLGAAIGNLVSQKMMTKMGVRKSDIYDYNFACPTVIHSNQKDDTIVSLPGISELSKYSNIFNIGNTFDIIVSLPSCFLLEGSFIYDHKQWIRYGVSYTFNGNFMDHDMLGYIDYLSKMKSEQEYSQYGFYKKVKTMLGVACPVDITVYDSSNKPVAGTINGVPEYYGYEPGKMASILVKDEKKMVTLFEDDNYRVVLSGTDDGTMQFAVAKMDLATDEVYSQKNYEGVNLFNGKTMSCEVNKTSDVVSIQLFVVNEEGEPVKEIEEKGEEKIIKHRIVFDCSGHGTTPKVQYVAPGDYVFEPLMMNDSGFEFKGWYTDKEFSEKWDFETDKVYSDMTLYAKWEEKSASLITDIKISPKSKQLKKGKSITLNAQIIPFDATNKSLTWTSSNTKVATVNSSGKVKAKGPGKATITATTQDGSGVSAKATITVSGVTLNTSKLVVQNGKTNKAVKYTLTKDKIKSVKANNKNVTVKTKGKALQITGKKNGESTITVATKGGSKAKLNVTVQTDKVITKKLRVSESSVSVNEGNVVTVKITATPDKISTGEKIIVKNSNKKVASHKLDQKTGEITITGKKKGTCKLTVKAGKKSKKITVKVTK